MREIKFRAYDKNRKSMHEVIHMYFTLVDSCYCVTLKQSKPNFLHNNDEVELMQYTGLKDKHGEEIYEGYIISIDGGAEPVITDVFFKDGCFCCKMLENTVELKYYINMTICETEIIGNIYENPELME